MEKQNSLSIPFSVSIFSQTVPIYTVATVDAEEGYDDPVLRALTGEDEGPVDEHGYTFYWEDVKGFMESNVKGYEEKPSTLIDFYDGTQIMTSIEFEKFNEMFKNFVNQRRKLYGIEQLT